MGRDAESPWVSPFDQHPNAIGNAVAADAMDAWAGYAQAWLSEQLGDAARQSLEHPTIFQHSPLEGEGAVAVFPFQLQRGSPGDGRHFVVVGRTEPNYYPAYDLTDDEMYSVHLGTRFMLVIFSTSGQGNEV